MQERRSVDRTLRDIEEHIGRMLGGTAPSKPAMEASTERHDHPSVSVQVHIHVHLNATDQIATQVAQRRKTSERSQT